MEYEAQIEVGSLGILSQEGVLAQYGITATRIPGEHKGVSFKGSYDALMKFLTEHYAMSSSEADTFISSTDEDEDEAGDCPKCGGKYEQGFYGDRCQDCGYEEGAPSDNFSNGPVSIPKTHEGKNMNEVNDDLGNCERCGGTGGLRNGNVCPACDGTGDKLESIEDQLKRQGLRLANNGEAGWYVMVTDRDADGTYGTKVWATDLPETQAEGKMNDFDKFMDVTLISEARTHGTTDNAASPQRRLARSYQENPLGRIKFGGKR